VIETSRGPVYSLVMEEHLLTAWPEIDDVAVVGVSVDSRSSAPVAVAWTEPGKRVDAQSLLNRFQEQRARSAERPALAAVVVVAAGDVPKGATGKVLKRMLRLLLKDLLVHPSSIRHLTYSLALAAPAHAPSTEAAV
jgi:long-chain acyl-CoA synthetase